MVDSPALGFGPPDPGTLKSDALHGQRGGPVRLDRYCLVVPAKLPGIPFPHLPRGNNPGPCTGWRWGWGARPTADAQEMITSPSFADVHVVK